MFVLQKLSSENEKLPDEDLSEEVYYSDEDADILLPPTVSTTSAGYRAENLPNPQPTVHHDHAALLSQLTSGNIPSQATIEMAVAQLKEALTAEEKQLMMQMVQQMLAMNPVLVATNPLALQVEAIRMILTTRGQMACLLSQPTVQQMALQAQLQNLTHLTQSSASQSANATVEPTQGASAAVEPTRNANCAAMAPAGATARGDSCPVDIAINHQEDVASEPVHYRMSDNSARQVPVQMRGDSIVSETDRKYPDECSSVSSGHVQPAAGSRPARGRGVGRGRSQSGFQYDDDTYPMDRPRGRGLRRARAGASDADEASQLQPGNGSASLRQPIVPPPLHTAPPVSYSTNFTDNPAENTSEDWEEEIDRFGPGMFQVQSSFFKSGKR